METKNNPEEINSNNSSTLNVITTPLAARKAKKPKKKYICYWDKNSKNTLTNDYELIDKIYYLYRLACYGIGTPKFSRRQNKLLVKPFVINSYDSLYLYDK